MKFFKRVIDNKKAFRYAQEPCYSGASLAERASKARLHNKRGAEMVEYILLVAIIALSLAGTYPLYRGALEAYYNRIANTMANEAP